MFWGLGMQFCIGLFVIRTQPGLIAFEWLGQQVQVLDLFVEKYAQGDLSFNMVITQDQLSVLHCHHKYTRYNSQSIGRHDINTCLYV